MYGVAVFSFLFFFFFGGGEGSKGVFMWREMECLSTFSRFFPMGSVRFEKKGNSY